MKNLQEEKPGLWANIRAQRARGEKPARKGSKDYKKAVKAAKEINKMKESQDHEVSMAQSSLEAIIKAAQELMVRLGSDERNIPGWIQDHITNAENYIEQAAQGFHELEGGGEEMELTQIMEGILKKKRKK